MIKQALFIAFTLLALYGKSTTLWVAPGTAVPNLEAALNQCHNGDTIRVKKAVYPCVNVFINKSITLIGEDYPVLDGQLKDEVLTITANDVSIEGFEVMNTRMGSIKDYAGIRVFKAQRISILNNKLTNTFFGIYLSDSRNVLVKGNHMVGASYGKSDAGNGIHLWKCEYITITGNHSEGHRDGIYFEFAKHCWIDHNFSEKNFRYGLHFMYSNGDTYMYNRFCNNGTGVAVMYSQDVNMQYNQFTDNWGGSAYGLLLKEIHSSIISRNTFQNNTIAIFMEGCNRISMRENDMIRNGYALKIMANCLNDTLEYNNFSGNTFDVSTNGSLQENLVDYNYWDKYEGYDLNHDGIGDVPYRPVSLYAQVVEQMPYSMMLYRSLITVIMDRMEKAVPTVMPDRIEDAHPNMHKIKR